MCALLYTNRVHTLESKLGLFRDRKKNTRKFYTPIIYMQSAHYPTQFKCFR